MDSIAFEDVSFHYEGTERDIFSHLSLKLPAAAEVTTLVGQNGTGKSTLLLMAAGRILPTRGKVFILGQETREITDEAELNRLAAVLYQNMEFETEESSGELLDMVRQRGYHDERGTDPKGSLLSDLIKALSLSKILNRPLQRTSKGEMQRIIVAFSLLYGSRTLMMDEPVFAMEDYHKEAALELIQDYAHSTGTAVFQSIHELHLARRYSSRALLFDKKGSITQGSTEDVLTDKAVEEAYQQPLNLLYQKENLFREGLKKPAQPS